MPVILQLCSTYLENSTCVPLYWFLAKALKWSLIILLCYMLHCMNGWQNFAKVLQKREAKCSAGSPLLGLCLLLRACRRGQRSRCVLLSHCKTVNGEIYDHGLQIIVYLCSTAYCLRTSPASFGSIQTSCHVIGTVGWGRESQENRIMPRSC